MAHTPSPQAPDWPRHRTDRRSGYDRRVNSPERRKVPDDPRRKGERREG